MFFCKIKKKGVVKPQCSGLKKIITKSQESPEVLANIKTNKHKEIGGGKKGKENTKTLTRSQNCQCVSLIMSSVTFSVCNDPPKSSCYLLAGTASQQQTSVMKSGSRLPQSCCAGSASQLH